VLTPNLICKPAAVLITKVTIKGAGQAVQMFGPAQAAVAKAVTDSVAAGVIPKSEADNLVIVCGVFIHWDSKDHKKNYDYNYEATKLAIQRAMKNEPKIDEILSKKDSAKHRFSPKLFNIGLAASLCERSCSARTNSWLNVIAMDKRKILIQLDSDPQPS